MCNKLKYDISTDFQSVVIPFTLHVYIVCTREIIGHVIASLFEMVVHPVCFELIHL